MIKKDATSKPVEVRNRKKEPLNPILIMLALLIAAMLLTHVLPAGRFSKVDDVVVAGSYRPIEKVNGVPALVALSPADPATTPARAGGIISILNAVPRGFATGSGLIFMVLFVGGMFGVLRATGAVDAGVDRLLQATSGNIYVLTTGLMVVLACGSSFLGFISEYVAVIPLVMLVGQRLGLPAIFAPAVVGVSAKIGYAASVSNPVALAVAQHLAGVPVFSGMLPRFVILVVMLSMGVTYVLMFLRKLPKSSPASHSEVQALTHRHVLTLLMLLAGGSFLLTGARLWEWHYPELTSAFFALSVLLAVAGGLRATLAADAFLDGMKSTVLAGLLIGLAGAVAVILQSSQVLDSIVQGLTMLVAGHAPGVVATALMGTEMVLDLAVPSLAAKAAISLPILVPLAHINGVSGQVAVTALLLGSGLNHLVSPTSAVLLAFLSLSKVGYGEWIRFIAPLWAALIVVSVITLLVLTAIGS